MGDVEKAKECLNNALRILETRPESVELVRAWCWWSGGLWSTGNMAEALRWAEKALELAEKLKDFEGIAESFFFVGTISGTAGDLKKAIEYLERALQIALDNGYTEIALRAYNNLGSGLGAEDYERRLEYYEKGYELAKKAGDIAFQSWLGDNLAEAYIDMGNMNKGVLLAEESVTLDRKTGHAYHLPLSLDLLGYAYHILGEWDKAEQYYQEAFNISQRLNDFQSISYSYASLGLLHFDKEEYAKGKEFFEKAYEVCEKRGAKSYAMWWSQAVIRTCIELGEVEKTKNLLDGLQEFALEEKDKGLMARTYACRAMLLRAQKKWDESLESFEKSLKEHEALNARRWDAYRFAKIVLCEYARVYLERDQEGDREKAHNLLNQALEIFQKLGAKKDIEKIIAKKKLLTA
jgi:tetratricopeptide (TPR) repeat protein